MNNAIELETNKKYLHLGKFVEDMDKRTLIKTLRFHCRLATTLKKEELLRVVKPLIDSTSKELLSFERWIEGNNW